MAEFLLVDGAVAVFVPVLPFTWVCLGPGHDGLNDDFAQARLGWEEEIEELKDMMDELNGTISDAAKDKLVLQKRIVAKRDAAVAADRATMRGSVRNLGTD